MLSVSTGHSAAYLTDQVGAGMESYYTGTAGAGEPPGLWYGRGAATLGLDGEVDADVMHAVYGTFLDPRDPAFADPETRSQGGVLGRAPKQFRTPDAVVAARVEAYSVAHASTPTPEQVHGWRVEAERDTPKAVGFYDLTFSPDKSVTVMHTAFVRAGHEARIAGDVPAAERWEFAACQVEAAMMDAAAAGLDYVQAHAAYTRVGRHGGKGATGRWDDAAGITAARFFQHTSRDLDPQLHVHQAVLNKVEGSDGKWRALDGRSIYAARPGAAAISEREMEAQLTRRLGITWEMRDDGVGRRVVGVDRDLEVLFSGRREAITADAERRLTEFEATLGRPANNIERTRIMQASTLATRRAKTHDGESTAEQYARWQAEAETMLAGGLTRQAAEFAYQWATGTPAGVVGEGFSPEAVIAQALEACHGDDGRATFSRHDLIRQLDLALPANLGVRSAGQAAALLEGLADAALVSGEAVQVAGREIGHAPAAGRLANGLAATIDPASVQYATRGHLAAELALLRSAGVRGATCVPRGQVEAWLDGPGASLAPAQREAVAGLMSSDAAVAVLVGPAGTGKSYAAGMLDAAWRDLTGGRVIGVSITQVAADVLADDGVTDTSNIAAFLTAQTRLTTSRPLPGDARWQLTAGDVLVVDEASMVDTAALTRLHAAAETAGARVVLMGDPHQLGPVGAGGMMRAAIDRDAETYTLADVRRFTAPWERDASLRLRGGDPTAVDAYDRAGRLVDAGIEKTAIAAIARAAAADRIAGKDVVVVTGSNEHATLVAAAVRRHLVEAGLVEEATTLLGRDGTGAGVGDLIQARRIDRDLGLVNRETYRITGVGDDGTLDVVSTRTGQPRVMPPAYVASDVTLAYASTAHGAQGRTVDVGHVLLTPGLDRAGGYVGLTRGRDANTAWAVTDTGDPDQNNTTARGLLSATLTRDHPTTGAEPVGNLDDLAAVDVAAADDTYRRHAGTLLALIEDETRIACRERLDTDLDHLVADGTISQAIRARFGAEQGSEHLSRLLRVYEQAGHDPEQVLREAIVGHRDLSDSHAVSQVVAYRINPDTTLPTPTHAANGAPWVGRIPADRAKYVTELGDLLGDRQRTLGTQTAAEPPVWAVATLGPVPDQVIARVEWETNAGIIAAQREASGWNHPDLAVGRCPGVHTPEQRAAWHAAYTAAGMPEERRPEAEMSEGRLLVRVEAAERARAGEPAAVHDAQRERHQAAEVAHREAILARTAGRHADADHLDTQAANHAAAAARLDQIAQARAQALVAHAETHSAGEHARDELIRRGRTRGTEPDRTTAHTYLKETGSPTAQRRPVEDVEGAESNREYLGWLSADRDARVADDPYRPITDADLHDPDKAADQARPLPAAEVDSAHVPPELPRHRATTMERPTQHLSAGAAAAEIEAAAAHSAAAVDDLADQASLDATALPAADDEWHQHHTPSKGDGLDNTATDAAGASDHMGRSGPAVDDVGGAQGVPDVMELS